MKRKKRKCQHSAAFQFLDIDAYGEATEERPVAAHRRLSENLLFSAPAIYAFFAASVFSFAACHQKENMPEYRDTSEIGRRHIAEVVARTCPPLFSLSSAQFTPPLRRAVAFISHAVQPRKDAPYRHMSAAAFAQKAHRSRFIFLPSPAPPPQDVDDMIRCRQPASRYAIASVSDHRHDAIYVRR
jgi:hypothetical protein